MFCSTTALSALHVKDATLSALHVNDATALERTFAHLTAPALETLEMGLGGRTPDTARTIGRALLRRKVHAVLDKSNGFGDVEAGLDIALPEAMRSRCLKARPTSRSADLATAISKRRRPGSSKFPNLGASFRSWVFFS